MSPSPLLGLSLQVEKKKKRVPAIGRGRKIPLQIMRFLDACTQPLCVCVLVARSCPSPCDPMGCSPLGSSVCGIFQARILEWVAISFSRGSSWPRDWTQVSCIAGRLFIVWATREENYYQHVRSGMGSSWHLLFLLLTFPHRISRSIGLLCFLTII